MKIVLEPFGAAKAFNRDHGLIPHTGRTMLGQYIIRRRLLGHFSGFSVPEVNVLIRNNIYPLWISDSIRNSKSTRPFLLRIL